MENQFIHFVSEVAIAFIIVLTPIILALTSIVKRAGLNSRYAPLFSIVLGLFFGYFYGSFANTSFNLLAGLLAGATASGVYSGAKKTIQG